MVTKTLKREERKKERKQTRAFLAAIVNVWLSENPGKTEADFSVFVKTDAGGRWLHRFFNESHVAES
jgi:hypothetical protein